jgi:hypothetical protein
MTCDDVSRGKAALLVDLRLGDSILGLLSKVACLLNKIIHDVNELYLNPSQAFARAVLNLIHSRITVLFDSF